MKIQKAKIILNYMDEIKKHNELVTNYNACFENCIVTLTNIVHCQNAIIELDGDPQMNLLLLKEQANNYLEYFKKIYANIKDSKEFDSLIKEREEVLIKISNLEYKAQENRLKFYFLEEELKPLEQKLIKIEQSILKIKDDTHPLNFLFLSKLPNFYKEQIEIYENALLQNGVDKNHPYYGFLKQIEKYNSSLLKSKAELEKIGQQIEEEPVLELKNLLSKSQVKKIHKKNPFIQQDTLKSVVYRLENKKYCNVDYDPGKGIFKHINLDENQRTTNKLIDQIIEKTIENFYYKEIITEDQMQSAKEELELI